MRTLKFKAHIDGCHRIDIQLPVDTPERKAEVNVLIPELVAATQGGLRTFFDNLDKHPPKRCHTKEEINAYLAKERASWT
jgi:hypothetical protein